VQTIKTLTFAALAGLPLAIVPAMAQSNMTTAQSAQGGAELQVPGTVNNTTTRPQIPNPTQHRDATGQTSGSASSGSSGGK
jgi:hypothetical protein